MAVAAAPSRATPEDLLALPDDRRYELVDGELVEKEMGIEASWIAGELFERLSVFNDQAQNGWVFPEDATFQCFAIERDRVRRPETSFVSRERLPGPQLPKGHCRVAPELAVEVTSPNDLFASVWHKVEEYLSAGVQVVWLVNPETRTVVAFRADGSITAFREDDELAEDSLLPGFRCPLRALFPPEPPAMASE